jgi:hypothetical protein
MANSMTAFVISVGQFNAAVTDAIRELADGQSQLKAALQSLTEAVDRFIRGQGRR